MTEVGAFDVYINVFVVAFPNCASQNESGVELPYAACPFAVAGESWVRVQV